MKSSDKLYYGICLLVLGILLVGCTSNEPIKNQITPKPEDTTVPTETHQPTIEPTITQPPSMLSQPLSFVRGGAERDQLAVMDIDGSIKLIADGLGYIFGFDWSPDGSEVLVGVFGPDYDETHEFNIWLVNGDGNKAVRLLENYQITDLRGFGWSPNGDSIYILANETLSITDKNSNTLMPVLDPGDYSDVRWSPDGQTFLFVEYDPENTFHYYTINRVNTDGSVLTVLTEGYDQEPYPIWSPDGGRIAYRGDGDIYLMNADGSGLSVLFSSPQPITWSPDGKRMAFLVFGAAISSFDAKYSALYPCVLEIDHPDDRTCYPEKVDIVPSWSQDGSQLITHRWRGRHETDTYLINLDSSEVIPLIENMFYPKWVPSDS